MIEKKFEEVIKIIQEDKGFKWLWSVYNHFPEYIIIPFFSEFCKIAQAAGKDTCYAYEYLPKDFMDKYIYSNALTSGST